MEAKYKVGEKVDINRDNEILEVEVFGILKEKLEGETFYSLRSGAQFYFLKESEILERPNV
jgi:hypothetical protein